MTTVREILQTKGDAVYSIKPTETLAAAVRQLNEHNCGSLVVCDGDQLIGIITERDILHAVADLEEQLRQISVESRMTADVITGNLEDRVDDVMGVMTDNRIRHLPVVEEGRLAGLISIGDVVKAHHAQLSIENHYLKSYIQS